MKTLVYIRFSATTIPGGPATILNATGCGPDVAEVDHIPALNRIGVAITLDDTDERGAKVLAFLARYGISSLVGRGDHYTEEEEQAAPLLRVLPGSHVFAGPRLGTKYDMDDACPACGTGARQRSALYVAGDDVLKIMRHRAITSAYRDLMVNKELAKKLGDGGVTGISFGDVYARLKDKSRNPVARQQVFAEHTMPPLSPKSSLVSRKQVCNVCQRGGYTSDLDVPYRLAYRVQDLATINDVNLTWEWFGDFKFNGKVSKALFASPEMLVTPKVMNIFREAGVKDFEWVPIWVDE